MFITRYYLAVYGTVPIQLILKFCFKILQKKFKFNFYTIEKKKNLVPSSRIRIQMEKNWDQDPVPHSNRCGSQTLLITGHKQKFNNACDQ